MLALPVIGTRRDKVVEKTSKGDRGGLITFAYAVKNQRNEDVLVATTRPTSGTEVVRTSLGVTERYFIWRCNRRPQAGPGR
jgi:hypothetical protein